MRAASWSLTLVFTAMSAVGCPAEPESAGADSAVLVSDATQDAADALAPDTAADTAATDTDVQQVACGNGVTEPGELCDDGAEANGGYGNCALDCQGMGPHCGDSITQTEHELCDDGAGNNGAYNNCGGDCTTLGTRCGDGITTTPEEFCDSGADFNGLYGFCGGNCQVYASHCGDGITDTGWESCDDGPLNGTDGHCPADCDPAPDCGDGAVTAPEVCDDGDALNGAYGQCAADCSGPGSACGDGVVDDGYELCDHGDDNGDYGFCATDCSVLGPHCGDGLIDDGFEVCDDGELNGSKGACAVDCSGLAAPWIDAPDDIALPPTDGLSCQDDDLLAKYFRYRRRLRGDGTAAYPGFVSVGAGAGQSVPASRREPQVDCHNHWSFTECPKEDIPDAKGMMNWGDGTIWQGDYLASLALEHALFTSLGVPTEETEADLAMALNAVDRLDLKAEEYYPGVQPVLDGFFVRDDAPEDLYLKPDGSYRFPRDDGFAGYECIRGDLLCDAPTIHGGAFTSQDQTVGLVFGLGVIAALVPDSAMSGGTPLREKARATTHRLVMHLRDNGWKVTDPNGDHPPDVWGGSALGFSNHIAKSANAICGDDFGVDDYRNFTSQTVGEAAWTGLQLIWEATLSFNRTMALRLAATSGVWDVEKFAGKAVGDGKDWFALVYAIMSGVELTAPFSSWRVESLLRTAPCSGPCRDTEGCANVPGWQGESRVISADDRIGSRHWDTAEFNGLDYMVLFAAWHLYEKGYWQLAETIKPPASCDGVLSLDAILAGGATDGATFAPGHPCNNAALTTMYCQRPLGAWIDDAARGVITIFAGGAKWGCEPGGACVLSVTSEGNSGGDDLIIGSSGPDDLSGGDGNDCIVGLGGDDVIKGNQGGDWLDGGDGDDELYGESGGLVLDGEGDVMHGGPGDDYLRGAPGKDELYGGEGHDTLEGGNSDDFIVGGPGNDSLDGGGGDDHLNGGPGDDVMIGDGGHDVLWGEGGRDKLDGEGGADHLAGGLGPDFLRGGNGDDSLFSGDIWSDPPQLDADRLCGNGGDDTLWGGWDGDECLGGGWFLGGDDSVDGCEDGNISTGDCDNGAWKSW